jgi:hypothetical protein
MTWPRLSHDILVTQADGHAVIVDRLSGDVWVADDSASRILTYRSEWADREDAAQWFAVQMSADIDEVRRDLEVFESSLPTPRLSTGRGTYLIPPTEPGRRVEPASGDRHRHDIELLGVGISVMIHGAQLEAAVRPLLAAHSRPKTVQHRVDVWQDDGSVRIGLAGRVLSSSSDLSLGVTKLMSLLTALALDHTPELSLLHAGGVVHNGKAILLGGSSNQGKSSTVVELLSRGMSYMSDEVMRVDLSNHIACGLPRPIGLDGDVRSRYPHLAPTWWPEDASSRRWPVPPERLGSVAGPTPLSLIILLRFDAQEGATTTRLSTTDALVSLMPLVYHRERWNEAMLRELTSLLVSVPTYLVGHAGSQEAADAVESIVSHVNVR